MTPFDAPSIAPPIAQRLAALRQRIRASEQQYARAPGSVQLLAVSKTQPLASLREALGAGQRAFAENYLQEALDKIAALAATPDLQWHFIGPIQSNKTRALAEHFAWVHTVDRARIAQRLHEQRNPALEPLRVLIQVNVSGEASKSGLSPTELPALAEHIAGLSRLRLCGLMCIPAPQPSFERQRLPFRQLRELRDQLLAAGHAHCRELSMGMSQDFEAAIAEGATLVRIGTDVFGPRA
ncbi:MAG TPA: YggS family pyridoxal phosphate-dependent enzyme [Hyphomicrobiales bacterium]|nr:YggS family pyridoxal phosphate-dependent enzyme [Hyphomicrobiales bacterium]